VKTVVRHVERSILESSHRSPNTQNNKNEVCCFCESCPARHCRRGGNCTEQQPCSCVFPYGNPLFSTPNPQFWSPLTPNLSQKFVYTFINIKRHLNPYETWIKTSFYHKSSTNPFFIKLPKTTQIHTITL
jgi:hypothetical protein